MPFHIESLSDALSIHNLTSAAKETVGRLACGSPLYDWSLREAAPDRLMMRPEDPWRGNARKAMSLLEAAGVGERTGAQWDSAWWTPNEADIIWYEHIHGFGWLRDLRTLGGAVAREQGRVMIESWLNTHSSWHQESWSAAVTGRRLSMWICHHDYFCADYDGVDHCFEDNFMGTLVKQAKHLINILPYTRELEAFEAIKGLLYAGIALEGREQWIEIAQDHLKKTIAAQILADGGHITRSPAIMLSVLELLVDIRCALIAGNRDVPVFLAASLESMSSAVRCLRHRDRHFALFNGTQEGNSEHIDSVLAQAGTHRKTKERLVETGYERIELGRSLMIMDTGHAAPVPYDTKAHASPLAFEMSYGKERLFVSCGTHPTSPEWQDALRFTAAHNTACLDQRNALEIRKDGGFGRKVTRATVHREDTRSQCFVVASHNGYVPLNGLNHTRKIFLSDEGHDLRGEDAFTADFELDEYVEAAIRFHLHPNVAASFIADGRDVLLRMPGGIGWRMKHNAAQIALEDSIYLGQGVTPRKTKQIVLYDTIRDNGAVVKWSVKREG